ncbi:MAG: hypothetical protein J6V03_03840 [Clostridia bacterium]|nr:hypothetical protein [Clostridia bacterium]
MTNKLKKFVSIIALVCVFVSFAACSNGNIDTTDITKEEKSGYVKGNRIEPDFSNVKIRKASNKVIKCKTEEDLIASLEAFANPNANEFDAISILGEFRFDMPYNKLRETMYTAVKNWQSVIVNKVGPACKVDIKLKSKTPIELSSETVKQWNKEFDSELQAYTNVKCEVSTIYAVNTKNFSFDIVKLDGVWYLANSGTINKLQEIITTHIYN